jgi:hypothetical protein
MEGWETFYWQSRNKGGNSGMIVCKRFKSALAAMTVVMAGGVMPVAAAPGGVTGTGDLSPDRTSAELTVAVQCDAPVNVGDTKTGNLTVHLFQPSGRLLNIGIGTAPVTCDGAQANVVVDVDAIPGLKFKPGPATVVLKLTEQTTDSTAVVTDSATTESGGKITLRP